MSFEDDAELPSILSLTASLGIDDVPDTNLGSPSYALSSSGLDGNTKTFMPMGMGMGDAFSFNTSSSSNSLNMDGNSSPESSTTSVFQTSNVMVICQNFIVLHVNVRKQKV